MRAFTAMLVSLAACNGADGGRTGELSDPSTSAAVASDMSGGTGSSTSTDAPTTTSEDASAANGTSTLDEVTGSTSTSETTATTTDTTTGAAPPIVHTVQITADNRHHVEMHGGWGPHLRGPMRAADDALWFTVDAGEDVLHNREVVYMRRGPGEPAWSELARGQHAAGVQQNAASILLDGVIYSYAVDIAAHRVEECTLLVADVAQHTCAPIVISGQPHVTPANSNYVGAAVLGPGWRIVWWTVVGENGAPGEFHYTYNYGGGWNGPVVSGLGDANDFAYVHAMRSATGELRLAGQAFIGKYPDGTYSARVADLTPGQPLALVALGSGDPKLVAQTAADLWVDPASDAVHVLATRSDASVGYYHRPGGAAPRGHAGGGRSGGLGARRAVRGAGPGGGVRGALGPVRRVADLPGDAGPGDRLCHVRPVPGQRRPDLAGLARVEQITAVATCAREKDPGPLRPRGVDPVSSVEILLLGSCRSVARSPTCVSPSRSSPCSPPAIRSRRRPAIRNPATPSPRRAATSIAGWS